MDHDSSRRRLLAGAGATVAAVAISRLADPSSANADTVAGWVGNGVIEVQPGARSATYSLPAGWFPTIAAGQAALAIVQGDHPDYWVTGTSVADDPSGATGGSVTVFLTTTVKAKEGPVPVYFATSGVVLPLP